MDRPFASRHLARLHEMVTNSSIARVATERGLVDHPALTEAAANDRATDEEIQGLARERGWSLPETQPYEWRLVAGINPVLPRVIRVVARDVFELEEMRRRTDDEDVISLANTLYNERRALASALEAAHPEFTLPGAK